MLLQEEQYIIHWLTEYGALTKTQIIRLLKDKPPQTAEKIIRGLKRNVMLHEISGGYYLGVDPMCQPDQRMILAVWVLLQFIDKVDPMAHYPATYPSQIFFLKEDMGYEIVVLYEGASTPGGPAVYLCSAPHPDGAGTGATLGAVPVRNRGLQWAGGARSAVFHRGKGESECRSLISTGPWMGPSAGWSALQARWPAPAVCWSRAIWQEHLAPPLPSRQRRRS